MQILTYQNHNSFSPPAMIYQNRSESTKTDSDLAGIRAAVRAWAADCHNREYVAALIAEEWRSSGSECLSIPTDSHRQMQKIFRWIDGDTEYAAENVRQLTPAIMAVLPLEYREKLAPVDSLVARLARMEKETSEAKIAVAMDAPRHQKLKELSEGIVEMYRVDPGLTGPLMEMVQMMLGVV
ncbi:toxin YdaT domain-containing protein [Citrobacter freundii]